MTLLMYACGCGHYEVVKLLLKHRICSVSTTDGAGWTALHYAVWGRVCGTVTVTGMWHGNSHGYVAR